MSKEYTALGLMSGTSGDGIDASIIRSDGQNKYEIIINKYFEYDKKTYDEYHKLRTKINNLRDLESLKEEISSLERKITLFHSKVVFEFKNQKIDLIGFHGQTIYHNPSEKISKQLGDTKLLIQNVKKNIIYNFRQNDIDNGGEGAPLTPIYHKLIILEKKINLPVSVLNIGGIANQTLINEKNQISSSDIGPGNCLIDQWIRINSDKKFDNKGDIAKSGIINKIILEQSLENFLNNNSNKKKSFDVTDFDISFIRGLSLSDVAATLTEFTAQILSKYLLYNNIYLCGGGRKNQFLIDRIRMVSKKNIKLIDELDIDGDFVESQAFAYLAIRSFLNLPISFPETTGVTKPITGGSIMKFK